MFNRAQIRTEDRTTRVAAVAVSYWLLCRFLRYRRRDGFARRYGYPTRESMKRMTPTHALAIARELAEQEFPMMMHSAVYFALLKTYAIPTISKLLASTNQLSCAGTVSKRLTDTSTLMAEVSVMEPESDRAIDAIARTNFLHRPYRKAGKISNDDMLYTLSMFSHEPQRWADKYDWRTLTDLEKCALGLHWKDVGTAMGISYDVLRPAMGDAEDGLTFYHALGEWSRKYEHQYMVPTDDNEKVAKSTLRLAMYNVPSWAKDFVTRMLSDLFESRLRKAIRLREPGRIHTWLVWLLVHFRKFLLRNFIPPRPYFLRVKYTADSANAQTGRFHAPSYVVHPWYMEPSIFTRWLSPAAWQTRLVGGILPGDDDKYQPQGWVVTELGPDRMRGKGIEEMKQDSEAIRSMRCRMDNF